MNVSRRWWTISALIVVVVASTLVVLAGSSQLIVSSNYLQVSGWTHQDDAWWGAELVDHNAAVGSVSVLASNAVTGGATEVPVTVSISPDFGKTDLKSVELIFSSNEILNVALAVLEGNPWSRVQFQRTIDGTGIFFNAADLGFMGTGTVTLGFFVEMDTGQQSMNYNIHFQLTLQNSAPFTFSDEVAETQLSIQYTRA
jgi:hypothetical protein